MTLLGGSLLGSRFNQNDVDDTVYKSSQGYGLGSSPFSFINKIRRKWDDATFKSAIASGSCTVTFVGTSITVGNVQLETMSSWVKSFQFNLANAYPDVDFTFHNLGLGGRSLSNYVDPSFVGLASEPADQNDGYFIAPNTVNFTSGSTIGQSWEEAVEATAPDLLVIAHGMNDRGSSYNFAKNLDTAILNSSAWVKAPSICLVSEMLPNKSLSWYENVRENAAITRNYAIAKGHGLIDVFRLWEALSNDRDVAESKAVRQLSISSWNQESGITELTSSSVKASGGNGSIYLDNKDISGVSANFNFKPLSTGSNMYFACNLPSDGDQTDTAFWIIRTGGVINIYPRGGVSEIAQFSVGAIVANEVEVYSIRIKNNYVEIYKDNVFVGRFLNPYTKGYGGVRIGMNTAEIPYIQIAIEERKPVFGKEQLSDNQLLGSKTSIDGWDAGDYSEGGNNINHPSRLGVNEVFEPAILDFIESIA